ncbi:hypothetical protein FRC02_002704 [Tulasnella sp. 418]|nr:hypothetical protein FRC02_002704 [Tulasnella sp. 418]
MRGLLEAYERNPSNEEFRALYTALLEKARRKNAYGVDWRGPYIGPYPHAQLAALDTLIAAVGVATE